MKYAFSATGFIFGLILVMVSSSFGYFMNIDLSQVGSAAGSFICSAAIFSAYFDWRGKQELSEYVWSEAKAAIEVKNAGISGFTENASQTDLSEDILNARNIKCITTYSSRFLKRYETEISTCLRKGGSVTIILQDEESPTIRAMKELSAWHFEEISANYHANNEIYTRLKNDGNIKLLRHKGIRAYSCLITDTKAHISLATNSNGRAKIPRITAKSNGSLYSFLNTDADRMIEQSNV